ncbi:helix-turn-helix domain-containing protein [Blautia pseudococcoides]|uniref:helix-turn-helix domain-containing protein n=1 Tax=Blautia pseudococcoides TaxID=1796616 RepID=UPI002378F12C|nr:helix-turn-helix domain-containing protein [Blautia pseudococcoides]
MHGYFRRYIPDAFGIPPIFLQRNMLFEKAKDHLVSSAMNINEISEELGFSEHAVFTRFFTERAGISPKEFRNTGF